MVGLVARLGGVSVARVGVVHGRGRASLPPVLHTTKRDVMAVRFELGCGRVCVENAFAAAHLLAIVALSFPDLVEIVVAVEQHKVELAPGGLRKHVVQRQV